MQKLYHRGRRVSRRNATEVLRSGMNSTQPFNEDQALAFLRRQDIPAEMLVSLARNPDALKSRKVLLALIAHPRTPRHTSIPLLRRVLTSDLMQIALTPVIAADLKRA